MSWWCRSNKLFKSRILNRAYLRSFQIWIKVHNISEDTYFLWEKSRFMNRYYGMQEMYEAKQDGSEEWNMPKERDPFYEQPDSPVFIASSVVFLQSLAYLIDVEEQFPIVDLSGKNEY